ncbi:MAG: cryptochrome/photolyase family protein, partial [Planctomycetota bacterium]|nr:cryptochrome/photolyase family protein [Planctomycetota bacterium]
MPTAALIYPHQLFHPHPATAGVDVVFVVEDPLFLRQYAFHKQKLMLHRATMKRFAREQCPNARYIDATELKDTGDIVRFVTAANCRTVRVVDPCDDWLGTRLRIACEAAGVAFQIVPDTQFLTPDSEISR